MYNISYDMAALAVIIVLNIIHLTMYSLKDEGNKLYQIFIGVLFFNGVFDLISANTIGGTWPASDGMNHLLNTTYLFFAMWTAFFAWKTIAAHIEWKHPVSICLNHLFNAVYLILLVLNLKTGIIFKFVEGEYIHGPLFFSSYAISVWYIFHGGFLLVAKYRQVHRRKLLLNSSFVVIPLFFAGIQIQHPELLLTVFATTLIAFLMCFALETPEYRRILNLVEELEQSKEEETKAREDAQMANQAKSRFLANMSHDIRTPLNVILGLDTMILRESNEDMICSYAKDIKNESENLLTIINDILDISKVESGKMELYEDEYEFGDLMADVITMISIKARDKNLSVTLNMDEKLPSRLIGDSVRIRQILVNLMNNGVKYTDSGYVSLNVSGEVKENQAYLHICVKDTGIGIKPEDLHKLSEEFERIEEKRNHGVEGTGLGITIVNQLLALMNSKLMVESEYGKGSVFYFDLVQPVVDMKPVGNVMEHLQSPAEHVDYQESLMAPDAKVLVVDDNDMNRKVFKALLSKTMIEIDEASSGKVGLEMCRKEKYDVIFLDHMMPEMDGLETLKRLNEMSDSMNSDTPRIVLTANAIAGAREEYMKVGFDDFISKPVDPDKLEKLLFRYLPAHKIKTSEERKELQDTNGKLPEIEGVRYDIALSNLKSVEFLKSVAEDFANSYESQGRNLAEFYAELIDENSTETIEMRLKAYRIQVHSMKSSAATVGAIGLSEIAKILEYAAKDGKQEEIIKLNDLFLAKWDEMGKLFVEAFVPKMEGNAIEAGNDVLMPILQLLRQSIEDMDLNAMDAVSANLKQYHFAPEVQEKVVAIEDAIFNIDYDQCLALIDELE